jgi:hypothetical protein
VGHAHSHSPEVTATKLGRAVRSTGPYTVSACRAQSKRCNSHSTRHSACNGVCSSWWYALNTYNTNVRSSAHDNMPPPPLLLLTAAPTPAPAPAPSLLLLLLLLPASLSFSAACQAAEPEAAEGAGGGAAPQQLWCRPTLCAHTCTSSSARLNRCWRATSALACSNSASALSAGT